MSHEKVKENFSQAMSAIDLAKNSNEEKEKTLLKKAKILLTEIVQQADSKAPSYSAAQYELAMLWKDENKEKSFKLMKESADSGYLPAINKIAVMYCDGFGVEEDRKKAVELLRNTAKTGDTEAEFWLALSLLKQSPGEKEEIIRLMNSAADKGLPNAQLMMSEFYQNDFLPKDFKKAFMWVQKAAEQNYPEAQYILAVMYYDGVGVEKNRMKSIKYFQKAAIQGDQASINSLIYLNFEN